MGSHGLEWKGTEVVRCSCQARLLGVKPGWSISMINGQTVMESHQVWAELNKWKKSGKKYFIYFVKDEATIRADQAKADAERAKKEKAEEERRKREESERRIAEEAKKKREDDLNKRKEEYWDKQQAGKEAPAEAAPAPAAAEEAPAENATEAPPAEEGGGGEAPAEGEAAPAEEEAAPPAEGE